MRHSNNPCPRSFSISLSAGSRRRPALFLLHLLRPSARLAALTARCPTRAPSLARGGAGRARPAQLAELTDKARPRPWAGCRPRIGPSCSTSRITRRRCRSAVDIDQPLFQPFPAEVKYKDYAAFGVYEPNALLPQQRQRRAADLQVLPPQSPFFEVVDCARRPRRARAGHASPRHGGVLRRQVPAAGGEGVPVGRPRVLHRARAATVSIRCARPLKCAALPDDVAFGAAPVKSTRSKTLIVQNVGTCTSTSRLRCTTLSPASPAEGIVADGPAMRHARARVHFDRARRAHGEMVVEYVGQSGGGSGAEAKDRDEVAVALQGVAERSRSSCHTPSTPSSAGISLSSQKTTCTAQPLADIRRARSSRGSSSARSRRRSRSARGCTAT